MQPYFLNTSTNVLAEGNCSIGGRSMSFYDIFPLEGGFRFSFQLPTSTFPYTLPVN